MEAQKKQRPRSKYQEATTLPYADRVLTTKRLRSLLKHRRTSLIPEALAKFLHGSYPEIHSTDAVEISNALLEIVDGVRAEVELAGIVSERSEHEPPQTLSARERNLVANFAALLVWTSEALGQIPYASSGDRTKRVALGREAVMWARVSTDIFQTALCMELLASCLQREVGELGTAAELREKAIVLLRTLSSAETDNLLVSILRSQSRFLLETGRLKEAASVIDEAFALIRDTTQSVDPQALVGALLIKGSIAYHGKEYSSAMASWQEGLQRSDPKIDPRAHCALLQSLAMLYERLEHSEKGLELLLQAIATLEDNGMATVGAWVYVTAAESYHRRGEFDRGFEILERIETILGLDPAKPPDRPNQITVNILITRANLLLVTQVFQEAVPILVWAIEKATEIEFNSSAVAACSILSRHFENQGNPDEACLYLERALTLSHGGSSRYNQIRLLLQLASVKIQTGDYKRAEEILDEVERDVESESALLPRVQRHRAELAECAGDFAVALAFERSAAELERKTFKQNRERSVHYARIIAELDMLERSVEQEKEQRRRLEVELTQAIAQLGEKERIIDEIRTVVSSVGYEGRASGQRQGTRNNAILSILNSESKKEHLSLDYLATVDKEFVKRARMAYPELTPRLERLAVLLRAGLNADEICTVMEIGSEGLKALRKRLRKSLKLVKGESLEHRVAEI